MEYEMFLHIVKMLQRLLQLVKLFQITASTEYYFVHF